MQRSKLTTTLLASEGKLTLSVVSGLLPEDVITMLAKSYVFETRTRKKPELVLDRDIRSYLVHGV